MGAINIGGRVKAAYETAGLTQRELSDLTEISQPTLSRIVAGDRVAKASELVDIARITGVPLSQLTGSGAASRVSCAARATSGSQMTQMRDKLIQFADLNTYLDAQAIQK